MTKFKIRDASFLITFFLLLFADSNNKIDVNRLLNVKSHLDLKMHVPFKQPKAS